MDTRYVTANSFSFCFVNTYQMPIPAQREQQPYPFTPTLLRAPSTNTVLYGRLVALSDLVKRYVSPLYCILTTSNLHYVHSANPPKRSTIRYHLVCIHIQQPGRRGKYRDRHAPDAYSGLGAYPMFVPFVLSKRLNRTCIHCSNSRDTDR